MATKDSLERFIAYYDRFGSDGKSMFTNNQSSKVLKRAFLYPAMEELLKSYIPGKKVLDIGCGTGIWCYQAARLGAESVQGFDIQEDIVRLAKQATAELKTVNIAVGDIENMPYRDNEFDVAISLYVTCNLPKEKLTKHFKELHRVLVPGGKAFVLNLTDSAYDTLYVTLETHKTIIKERIDLILAQLPVCPTKAQVTSAFEHVDEILRACFATDEMGHIFHVTNASQLCNGQAVWNKKQSVVFPDYYYSDHFLKFQIVESGLDIDQVQNIFTEERRITYNATHTKNKIEKTFVTNPCALMYHISKPSY